MANLYTLTVLNSAMVKTGVTFEETVGVSPKKAFLHALAQFPLPEDLKMVRFEKVGDPTPTPTRIASDVPDFTGERLMGY